MMILRVLNRGKYLVLIIALGYPTYYLVDLKFKEQLKRYRDHEKLYNVDEQRMLLNKINLPSRLSLSTFLSLIYYEWVYKICTDIYSTDKRIYLESIKQLKNYF